MEKMLKTNVYFNDTVFCDNGEIAIDVDFTLPDYCPDISKIFKCLCVPRISSKGINGKTITIDGVVELTVLYCDKDENFSSFCYQYPIVKNFEMAEETIGACLSARIKTDYINCRAVSGRKVDIHGACSVKAKVTRRKCTEIVSDFDDSTVELKRGTAPATVPMGYSEKYILIEEEIKIGDSKPQIKNILRSNATSFVKETKIINGKVMVKGECAVSVLYCLENSSKPEALKTLIPFSQILDMEGVTDSCECETKSSVAFCEIKPKMSVLGENKSFAVTVKVELCSTAFCGNDIAIIEDAFSRKFEAEIESQNITFEKITHNLSETHHLKHNIKLEENISSVIDLSASLNSVTTKFEGENICFCGNILSGCVILSEEGKITYQEKSFEFEYKHPLKTELLSPFCEPNIQVDSLTYTIVSADTLEIRVDLSVEAAVYERRELGLISDLKIDETKPSKKSKKGAMTIYFPSKNEKVWDIARIYNASVEEIMRINELETEELPIGKMLLVPVM